MTNFSRTVSSFFQNPFVNPYIATMKHIGWQFRKLLNIFPYDIKVDEKIVVRIKNRDIANGCGALINAMGFYDPNNMNLIIDTLGKKEYKIFFDIGANIGIYSLIAGAVPGTKVFSFEPHPETYSFLIENISHNISHDHIMCFQKALGDKDGYVLFSDVPGSPINHVLENDQNHSTNEITVDLIRGDTFCRSRNVSPDILKIDVEGFENIVLKGFGEFLGDVQIIFIESRFLEETVKILCDHYGFLGPYKVDFRVKKFNKKNTSYEDWVFLHARSLPFFQTLGYIFAMDE